MYPDLSYLFHALIGTEPDNWLSIFKTFGFFLAIAFLVSAVVFSAELRRKAREGYYVPTPMLIREGEPASWAEIAANALVGLLLLGKGAYAYAHFEQFRTDPASALLSMKMNWGAGLVGALLLGGLTWWDAHRKRLPQPLEREVQLWPHDRISEMTVWAAVGGISGSKLFDIFDNWESFVEHPIETLLSGGGLAFLGGLILGFVAVVSYIYRKRIPFWPTADAVAPALTAGYGVGRIGCQLSGDGDWGIVNTAPKPGWMSALPDWMWGFQYPHHVLNTVRTDPAPSVPIEGCTWDYCLQLSQPVYPTPFYEIVMMSLIFAVLWGLRKRVKVTGMLFFIYLCLIAAERFLIEKIRVNVVHDVLGMRLTQAEIISILIFLIGLGGMAYVWKKHRHEAPLRRVQ
ncbi:MAG TPA: prolipoprotein diacylglyceryl transferase [Saprospiraceae bacterium]|nr:prolipoprotein diacylglyceryl transferase [Saprospiraceae bacterium]HND88128.1 prolipoprotein diacylglyceryl transferase [Saprospiraceae bacterium]